MQVDPAAGKPVHEHAGTIYHFCCEGCRRKFAENPQHYLDAQASPAPDVGDAPPGTFWICPMDPEVRQDHPGARSEEHTSELQSLMRISYAVLCLKKKKNHT